MTVGTTTRTGNQRGRDLARIVVIFLLALLPLASTPVLPFIDFYNHLARYFVMAHIGGDPALAQNYAVHWTLLPNLGLDVIGAGLMSVMPATAVPRLICLLILVAQYTGALALHRALGGRAPLLVALLAAGLLYSYVLIWGFSNFLLGLGLSLSATALWLTTRQRPVFSLALLAPLAVVIFMIHGFAFALYGIVVAGLAFGLWLSAPQRRLLDLMKSGALLLAQAVLPALIFLNTPTAGAPGGILGGAPARYAGHHAALAARLIMVAEHRVDAVIRVAEGPSFVFDAITFALTLLGFGYLLLRRRVFVHRAVWPALAMLAVLTVILPPALFGVGYVADRVPLAFALVLVAALQPRFASLQEQRAVLAAVAVLTAVRIGAVTLQWSAYRPTYAAFRTAAAVIPSGSLVAGFIDLGDDTRDGFKPHCEMYAPLTVLLRGAITPVFAEATKQPISLIGPLAAAQGTPPVRPNLRIYPAPYYYDDLLAQTAQQQKFDFVVMCGRSRLQRPLPANTKIVASAGPVEILTIEKAAARGPGPKFGD